MAAARVLVVVREVGWPGWRLTILIGAAFGGAFEDRLEEDGGVADALGVALQALGGGDGAGNAGLLRVVSVSVEKFVFRSDVPSTPQVQEPER